MFFYRKAYNFILISSYNFKDTKKLLFSTFKRQSKVTSKIILKHKAHFIAPLSYDDSFYLLPKVSDRLLYRISFTDRPVVH